MHPSYRQKRSRSVLKHPGEHFQTGYIATRLLFSTTRVQCLDEDGVVVGSGTGFFFRFGSGENTSLQLITNRHVVDGCAGISFRVHITQQVAPGHSRLTGAAAVLTLPDVHPGRIDHPDHLVDLTSIDIDAVFKSWPAPAAGLMIQGYPFEEGHIASQEFLGQASAAEPLIMIGCPKGEFDEVNHFPILRSGISASHPFTDYNGRAEGLADIGSFEGSSGSPIVLYDAQRIWKGNRLEMKEQMKLIGIAQSFPIDEREGQLDFAGTNPSNAKSTTIMPMHLMTYVKARRLLELKNAVLGAAAT